MTNNTTSFAASLTSTAQQRNRRHRNEGNVKLDLSQLIEALGYGPVENEYTILGGSIDIYIPHHRVIIETKGARARKRSAQAASRRQGEPEGATRPLCAERDPERTGLVRVGPRKPVQAPVDRNRNGRMRVACLAVPSQAHS